MKTIDIHQNDGWDRVIAFIEGSSSPILVVSHIFPDGDAIGSLIAFGGLLERLGKTHLLALGDPCPEKYRFLTGWDQIRNLQKLPGEETYTRVVILDAGAFHRIGAAKQLIAPDAVILNIDHHYTSESYGNINLVDPEASATCEIIFSLFRRMGVDIGEKEAYALFTGIVTDTGRFRFSNTTATSLRICAELIDLGVNPGLVVERVYYEFPPDHMKALGVALQNLEFYDEGRIGVMQLPLAFVAEDTEGFVEYATSIQGVFVGILITQMGPGQWKVSLRSRSSIDVSQIAKEFGGGGHKKAAGFKFKGDVDALKERLITALEIYLQREMERGTIEWTVHHPEG